MLTINIRGVIDIKGAIEHKETIEKQIEEGCKNYYNSCHNCCHKNTSFLCYGNIMYKRDMYYCELWKANDLKKAIIR